ncbi:MAG: cell division ATP-binding protein FtsE [Bacteroidia bacterium]
MNIFVNCISQTNLILIAIEPSSIISFNGVTYRRGTRVLLDAVSFDIHLGEFVYLVGKTGAGKSTIMRLVYADLAPTRGFIRVGKQQLGQLGPKSTPHLRRDMGIVFQDFQLLPDRTVYHNIQFALKATGWRDRKKIKQRIEEVLMQVGMTGKANAMPYQLSGGEQQRVSIARALINDPMILIADEPTGNLDPEASRHVMDVIRRINLSGTAVLMVTHEYDIIKDYPSRVLELEKGNLTDFQRGSDFLDHYGKIPSSR